MAGFAEYRDVGGVRVFTHTEVDDAFEGQGVGSALARGALDDVREREMKLRPRCPFIKSFIEQPPGVRRPPGLTRAAEHAVTGADVRRWA